MRTWPALLCVAVPITLQSQVATPVIFQTDSQNPSRSARVRLTAPGMLAGQFRGPLLRRSDDSVTILLNARTALALPVSRLSSLEISEGKSRRLGAIYGAILFAPIGVLLEILDTRTHAEYCGSPRCNDPFDYRQVPQPVTGRVIFAGLLGGAATGALLGAWRGKESWKRIDLSSRASVGVRSERADSAGSLIASP